MSQGTDNVGSTGRFGPRYGTSVRRRIQQIEEVQFDEHRCPQCLTGELKRVSTSIWQCRKCDHKFAGGAYKPQTDAFGKAKASADELEEIETEFEEELEEEAEAEEPEPEPEPEPTDEAPEEPEPEPEPEPEADEADDEDDEPDSIESLFE
jgi:large subunit ribosomal protein L37Ae